MTAVQSAKQATKRVGVIGGSFDPVHRGHVAIAEGVAKHFNLQQMRFLPCSVHSFGKAFVASTEQRLAMLELAIASLKNQAEGVTYSIDTQEIERDAVSYTVDSCEALRCSLGDDAIICFVMGSDSLSGLHKWKRWQHITELVNVVIVDRARESALGEQPEVISEPDSEFDIEASKFLTIRPQPEVLEWLEQTADSIDEPAGQIARLRLPPLPFSSTTIRSQLKARVSTSANEDIALENTLLQALHPDVFNFINKHHIYA